MDLREILERRLADTERRISELEQHVARQRSVVAWLDSVGRGTGESGDIARDLLQTMEFNVRRETAERTRLLAQLGPT